MNVECRMFSYTNFTQLENKQYYIKGVPVYACNKWEWKETSSVTLIYFFMMLHLWHVKWCNIIRFIIVSAFLNSIDPDKPVHLQSGQDLHCSHTTNISMYEASVNLCRFRLSEQIDKMIWTYNIQKSQLVLFLMHWLIYLNIAWILPGA